MNLYWQNVTLAEAFMFISWEQQKCNVPDFADTTSKTAGISGTWGGEHCPRHSGSSQELQEIIRLSKLKLKEVKFTDFITSQLCVRVRWVSYVSVMSCPLTLLCQVMLFCFTLHIFTPALQAFGLTVEKLHEPAAVTPEGRHAAGFGCFVRGFHQPGFGLRAGRPTGRPVILTVTEEALRPYGSHHVVLCRCTGFGVPLESSKLQTLVFCGREPLQL